MANIIKIKQSSVASKVPLAGDLEQGELALNTLDEKLYTKNSTGVVVELGAGGSSVSFTSSTTTPASPTNGETWYDPSDSNLYMWVGTQWIAIGGAGNLLSEIDGGDAETTIYTNTIDGGIA